MGAKKIGLCARGVLFAAICGCLLSSGNTTIIFHAFVTGGDKYDTIFFARGVKDLECLSSVAGIIVNKEYCTSKGPKTGNTLWVDSVLYKACWPKHLVILASRPDKWGYEWVWFNGKEFESKIVAKNRPSVKEYKFNGFSVVSVSGAIYTYGDWVQTTFFFRLSNAGQLAEEFSVDQKLDGGRKPIDKDLTVNRLEDGLVIVLTNVRSGEVEKRIISRRDG